MHGMFRGKIITLWIVFDYLPQQVLRVEQYMPELRCILFDMLCLNIIKLSFL